MSRFRGSLDSASESPCPAAEITRTFWMAIRQSPFPMCSKTVQPKANYSKFVQCMALQNSNLESELTTVSSLNSLNDRVINANGISLENVDYSMAVQVAINLKKIF